MTITRYDPDTIMLHSVLDNPVIENDKIASEAITPGMLVELVADGTESKVRKNASATNQVEMAVALNQSMLNRGVDDAYPAGDLVEVWKLQVGDMFWGIVPSGQDIAINDLLQSNGDGKLKEATSAAAGDNVARFKAKSAPGAVTADTRVKVERIN